MEKKIWVFTIENLKKEDNILVQINIRVEK